MKAKLGLLALLTIILMLVRFYTKGFEIGVFVAAVIGPLPFLYWWTIPYILRTSMELPSWGFALEAGKDDVLRFLLFLLGIAIYLVCMDI